MPGLHQKRAPKIAAPGSLAVDFESRAILPVEVEAHLIWANWQDIADIVDYY